jgi:hypothetical protein
MMITLWCLWFFIHSHIFWETGTQHDEHLYPMGGAAPCRHFDGLFLG